MPHQISHTGLSKFARQHMQPLPGTPGGRTLVQASDPQMEMTSKVLLQEIFADVIPLMPDEADYAQDGRFDCDDFAFAFKGLVCKWYQKKRPNQLPVAVGVGWGMFKTFGNRAYHALNWVFLDDDRRLYWIEPQFVTTRSFDATLEPFSKTHDRVNLLIV